MRRYSGLTAAGAWFQARLKPPEPKSFTLLPGRHASVMRRRLSPHCHDVLFALEALREGRRLSACDPPWCSLFGDRDGCEGSGRLVMTLQIDLSAPRQTVRSQGAWAPPSMSSIGRLRYHHPGRRPGPVTGREAWPRW